LVENIAKSPMKIPNPERTTSPAIKRGRNTDLADRRSPSKQKITKAQFEQYDSENIVIRDEHAIKSVAGVGKELKLRESIMSGASGGKGLNYNLSSSDEGDKYMQQEPLHTQPNKEVRQKGKEDFNFDMGTIPFSEDPNPHDGKRALPSF